MSDGTAARNLQEPTPHDGPVLLQELESWHRVFWHNLVDLLAGRTVPHFETTSSPVPVAEETFIQTGVRLSRVAESFAYHVGAVVLIYLLSTVPWMPRSPQLQSPVRGTTIAYYPTSDYIPAIDTGRSKTALPRKGAPKLSRQEILSVPPETDNTRQTIITPPKVHLQHDVALPNIVAWTSVPDQPPLASSQLISKLTLPHFDVQPVEPTADLSKAKSQLRTPELPGPAVVAPVADVAGLRSKRSVTLPEASVIQPAIDTSNLPAKLRLPNLPSATVVEPSIAPSQLANLHSGKAGHGQFGAAPAVAPPIPEAPSLQGLRNSQGQGRIIALGVNPADVRGPIDVPTGNRSGEFHTSPSGKADAPGTPNIVDTGKINGTGNRHGAGDAPPGIHVGAPPAGATAAAVTGAAGPTRTPSAAEMEARKQIIAAAMRPSLGTISRRPPPPSPPPTPEDWNDRSVEKRVFGTKPYYSMILNMPNLTSVTGSWVIRYAELKTGSAKGQLAAPVATIKVDPAYIPDAMRDHVEGTVTLYAVIHADGSVGGIRVLNSLDSRLDTSAIRALSRWHFRPGTKNGEPVDIEAVVQIPFQMKKWQ
jgi:TonB family protein